MAVRDGIPRTNKELEAVTPREIQCLNLRIAGLRYDQIAKAVGYESKSSAYDAVRRALLKTRQEPAEELRQLELTRLDAAQAAIWPRVLKGELDAVAAFLRLSKRRAEIVGLDAPVKIDVTHEIRRMAIAEGIDPDQAVKDAEEILAASGAAGLNRAVKQQSEE